MSNLSGLNPLRKLANLEPFDRQVEDLFKGFFLTPMSLNAMNAGQFPIDVTEDEKTYQIRAEIPGFKKDEIQVSIDRDQVTISAETRKEKEDKKEGQVVLKECYYGKQYRSFTLPQAVDETKTSAKYENGVLSLALPKKSNGNAQKIAIQ